MDRIIDGKDLANMKFIKDSEGRLMEYKTLGKYNPKMNEKYCFIDDYSDVCNTIWSDRNADKWRLKHYKLFRTEEECEDYKWFLEQVDKYSYEFSHEEWKNSGARKYYIYYDFTTRKLNVDDVGLHKDSGVVYFKSFQNRCDFINKVGEERIKKYMFDIWD